MAPGETPGGVQTLPDAPSLERQRRARLLRRVFLTLLALFVLAAFTGVWGVRSSRASASEEGWTLKVHFARTTRAGLAVPLTWDVAKEGGFPEDKVVVRITQNYFALFDENGIDPEPSSSWSDGEYVYWEFDAEPGGEVMHITADTRTGSGVQLTQKHAESAVFVDDRALATVKLKTLVLP